MTKDIQCAESEFDTFEFVISKYICCVYEYTVEELCPRYSTQVSDVLKNPKYIKNDKSMDSPEISLSYQANIADETISSMDVKSFDNRFTQVKNTRI